MSILMKQIKIDKLKAALAVGNVVTVVGTGVSVAACPGLKIADHAVATWQGLLAYGVEYCRSNNLMTGDEADAHRGLIKIGTISLLLLVAEDITQRMRKSSLGVFRGWLEDTIGQIKAPDPLPPILMALRTMPGWLATLNYDNLIEDATGRSAVTWRESNKVEKVLASTANNAVLHLHGHYTEPESVVLGSRSYDTVKDDGHAAAVLKSLAINRTLLFVGCGDTVLDPNFARLIEWARDALHDVVPRHYLLCRDADVKGFQEKLADAPWLQPLAYGDNYADLAPFLMSLHDDGASAVAPVTPPPAGPATPAEAVPDGAAARGHYGLDDILENCSLQLQRTPLLALCGLTGAGKTVIARELRQLPAWRHLRMHTHVAQEHGGAADLFGALANLLCIYDERPRLPVAANAQEMAAKLLAMSARTPAFFLHIERGHLWFNGGRWRPECVGIADLLSALVKAYSGSVIVLETREAPEELTTIEASGLPRAAMKQYLASPPVSDCGGWTLNKTQIDYIFQRMGGGHGRGAHAFGLALLAQLAAEKKTTPEQVLRQYADDYALELYAKLFRDIYENVLAPPERALLYACSLYRSGLHYSHLARLETVMTSSAAGESLIRRRLLAEDAEWFYLHDLAAEQAHKLAPDAARTLDLQRHIASFWMSDLQGQNNLLEANIRRALEALYHLEQAGETWRITEIAAELLGRRPGEAASILWRMEKSLVAQGPRQAERVCIVLDYLLKVAPDDGKAMRFLGEYRRKLYGKDDARALELFRTAAQIYPSFPPSWANFGHAAISCGERALQEFLAAIANAPAVAINEQVAVILAGALQAAGRPEEASALRRKHIADGSGDAAFYSDEAKWLLDQDDIAGAVALLEQARRKGCADDYTESMLASALQAAGRPEEALALRRKHIADGSGNSAFYSDEARWLLDQHDTAGAIALLEQARIRGCANDYTESTLAGALQAAGRPEEASALRRKHIADGSGNAAFYSDEAKWLLDQHDTAGAIALLEQARIRGCANDYTESTLAGALQAAGRPEDASALRRKLIADGSGNAIFYSDEAKWLLDQHDTAGAMALLEQARIRGCANDYTVSILASALQAAGRPEDASALRRKHIADGSGNVVFYNGEAKWLLDQHDADGAIALLEQARSKGYTDDYTDSILASALQAAGRPEEASALRRKRIADGSGDAAFYTAEAKWLLDQQDTAGGIALLEQAHNEGWANDYTELIVARERREGDAGS
ncbi:SIR2 family protein [Massilia sp. CCM 9210]|uniref:SIR2 family protein n=1 Tax=Massilia scottii TaxID=3057166 RepID=UPI00279676CF|nr:SIR2 family protein [Massilia sp. CCM 9210]MDQ1815524.1 SIR2 family protein [Massilia sp. CCM 9210]